MAKSKSLYVTFTAINKETKEEHSTDIDVCSESDLDDILSQILDDSDVEEDDKENWELSDVITSTEGIHANYLTQGNIFEYAEAYQDSSYELEVLNAAIDCDVNLSDIDEAYSGAFDDNEGFAREMSDNTGAVSENVTWPLTCIDWEWAAKELMYDYSESNGHYFLNL